MTAEFVPVAFHVHSPESHDWAKGPGLDPTLNDAAALGNSSAFLDELAKHHAIVCVTDHMTSKYACELAAAARKRSDITVLPGVEIGCDGGQLGASQIHVLAIFPEDTAALAIERIYAIHQGPPPLATERTGKETLRVKSLEELATAIHKAGGLFVLPHIEEERRGHRARFRATRHRTLTIERTTDGSESGEEISRQASEEYFHYIAELRPDALEITNPEDKIHFASFTLSDDSEHGMPCVSRSDHHSVESLANERAVTYLKVSRADFKCVRDALQFHETRIRFGTDRPATPSPRLVGVRLRCSGGTGLFDEAVIAFNPNLNCIIGPRGSGKSTVIEAIRYVLGQAHSVSESPDDANQPQFTEIAERIQKANLRDTLIELVYEADDTRYVLSATYDPAAQDTTSVHALDGTPRPMTSAGIRSDFPVRIYSWSEIETLGRKPEHQRTLLDRLVPELTPLLAKRSDLRASLAANRIEVDHQCRVLDQLALGDGGLLRRYRQYRSDFEHVNTEEVAVMFGALDQARGQVQVLSSIKAKLIELRSRLTGAVLESDLTIEVALDLQKWWEGPRASLQLGALESDLRGLTANAAELLDTRLARLDELIGEHEAHAATTEAALRQTTQIAPDQEIRRDQREERKKRFDAAVDRRNEYQQAYSELTRLLGIRAGMTIDLDSVQSDISNRRELGRSTILDSLSEAETGLPIDVELKKGADRAVPIGSLRENGMLTRDVFGHYREKKIAEKTFTMTTPTQVVRCVLSGQTDALEVDGVKLGSPEALTSEEASKLTGPLLLVHFY